MPRKKQTKGINLRSDGRWCKTYKGKKCYLGRGTRAEAEKEFEAIVARDTLGMSEPTGDDLTVSQLCTLFLKTKERQVKAGKFAAATYRGYGNDLRWLCGHMGKRKVDNLKGYDFTLLMEHLDDFKANAINTKVTRVKAMLNWAVAQDIIERRPSLGDFKLVRSSQKRQERAEADSRVFSHNEAQRLLDGARGVWKAIMMLGLNCAMEGSEIGRLKHSDIDGEWLSKPRGKTGIQRTCWLWPETRELIEEHRSDHPELLFLNRRGNPFDVDTNPQAITRPFKILRDRIGLDRDIGFHGWRRTFATIASTLPVSERTIRCVTAHAHNDMLNDHYIEGIDRHEIKKVCEGVRFWLVDQSGYQEWLSIKSQDLSAWTGSDDDELVGDPEEVMRLYEKEHWFLR